MPDETTPEKATTLLRLHQAPELLTVVNVWDVISARVVAQVDGTTALATASHSIAASYGYEDGENIPRDLMLEAVGRIVDATDLPVTADLEGGYGDPVETVRRAMGIGVVGANIEDQMRPVAEAAANVEKIMKAAEAEGVDFVLNARTDAFVKGRDRDQAEVLADAVERGKAFLDAGAPVVFVPGKLDEQQVTTLVDALGPQRLTLIGIPGIPPLSRLQELGVARVSYGPMSQNVALTALQELVEDVHRGGGVPSAMRILNQRVGTTSTPELPDAEVRDRLGAVHFQKIRMADEVFIVDPDGYVGESTRREIAYAESLGKPVRYLSRERPTGRR